ncbi:fimbrial protein [Proteus vulgaris]|uniref:fimbrial protein n=1 Tax=Proteus TaxID=583 RepID=UPI001E55ECB1|nr:fimbrial protein [Proteus vulgaris]
MKLNCHYFSFKTAILSVLMLIPTFVSATCYKITTTNTNPRSNYYTEPGKGTAKSWAGARDDSGSMGTTPKVINVNNDQFQPPGTLVASGFVSMLDAGYETYDPEQILFRCTADEEGKLREFYSTNGDYAYGGNKLVNPALGLNETYISLARGLGIRIKNTITGEYYSRYWKSRPLTNLDRDSQNWILVKAKDFSNMEVELFKINYERTGDMPPAQSSSGLITFVNQPAGYIAFQSSNYSYLLKDGSDHASNYHGFYAYWPASVNMSRRIYIRNAATCFVRNVTPYVSFPLVTVNELASGKKVTLPIDINFYCQIASPANDGVGNMLTGTGTGQTAMGFLPRPANVNKAIELGLTVPNGGAITHLVTDGYGTNNNMAKGVGVRIYRPNGMPLNLLSTLASEGQGEAYGWYSVLEDAQSLSYNNGVSELTKTLYASLEALPREQITMGKFSATLQVIIQVQ